MNRNVLISACVLGLLALPSRAGADRKKPGALMVLDASGSMAGKVAGRTKMTIAREVVEAHGGQITLKSTEGQGTTFTVVLPLHHEPKGTARS